MDRRNLRKPAAEQVAGFLFFHERADPCRNLHSWFGLIAGLLFSSVL
jgi:hypothetical protein